MPAGGVTPPAGGVTGDADADFHHQLHQRDAFVVVPAEQQRPRSGQGTGDTDSKSKWINYCQGYTW